MEATAAGSLTHHVRLVLDNDYGLYQERRGIVQDHLSGPDAEHPSVLGDKLKDWAEELAGLEVPTVTLFQREILMTALAWVDWLEIAQDYIEEEQDA